MTAVVAIFIPIIEDFAKKQGIAHSKLLMPLSFASILGGTLTLIGAGPWAEIYCDEVKKRGGVAIDIGSGFDILSGHFSRPVHGKVNFLKSFSSH